MAASASDPSQDELASTIKALSECADDALSKAVCEGIIDPAEAIDWAARAKRVILYQRDCAGLRSEIPSLVDRLQSLLRQVELPANHTPESVARGFVVKLPRVRLMLAEDVEAAFEGDPAAKSFAEIVVSYPSIKALTIHRIAHELYLLGVPLLPRIMSEWAHDRTGIDIHPGARIGHRFFIDHGTGVVVGETSEIGSGVRLYQGVIGGNVWLTESVPPGSKVVAEPARHLVRQRSDPTDPDQGELNWEI